MDDLHFSIKRFHGICGVEGCHVLECMNKFSFTKENFNCFAMQHGCHEISLFSIYFNTRNIYFLFAWEGFYSSRVVGQGNSELFCHE